MTGNTGQTSAPTGTTAVDSVTNLYIGGTSPACTPYRTATPSAAGAWFFPLFGLHTGAVATVDVAPFNWIDIAGAIVVPPNAWVALSASATATSAVIQTAIVWEEVAL